MGLFGSKSSGSDTGSHSARILRHSSGWGQISKFMGATESLRVLDFGPTSAGNINLITNLGHGIYMANIVDDAARPDYLVPPDAGETPAYDISRFMSENLDFQGRIFDVVLFWDTFDYLPKELAQPVAERLFEVMSPGGQLLAFFHANAPSGVSQKINSGDTVFSRYHLTSDAQVELQAIGKRPLLQTYTNRQVEAVFHSFSNFKFLLAKDNLREVIVTR